MGHLQMDSGANPGQQQPPPTAMSMAGQNPQRQNPQQQLPNMGGAGGGVNTMGSMSHLQMDGGANVYSQWQH